MEEIRSIAETWEERLSKMIVEFSEKRKQWKESDEQWRKRWKELDEQWKAQADSTGDDSDDDCNCDDNAVVESDPERADARFTSELENQQPNPQPQADSRSTVEIGNNNTFFKFLSSTPKLELECPKFDGTNPRNWIQKCGRYMELLKHPDYQRVDIASLYMVGKADEWMRGYLSIRRGVCWNEFVMDLLGKFGDEGVDVCETNGKLEVASESAMKPDIEENSVSGDNILSSVVVSEVANDVLKVAIEPGKGRNPQLETEKVPTTIAPELFDESSKKEKLIVEAYELSKVQISKESIEPMVHLLNSDILLEVTKFDSSHDWGEDYLVVVKKELEEELLKLSHVSRINSGQRTTIFQRRVKDMVTNAEAKRCLLCAEEMDLTDQQLKPCKCGYQVCVWCWHQIMDMVEEDWTEGRCPACRPHYDKDKIVGMEANFERVVANANRKHKPPKARSKANEGKKDLSIVRVIQRKMAYMIGLPLSLADEDLLKRKDFLGQYGKICKISLSRTAGGALQQFVNDNCSIYITFLKEEEAVRCIQYVHGFVLEGRFLRASFGTAKYCHEWLRNVPYNNSAYLYLHSLGAEEDSFGKDEVAAVHTRSRVQQIAGATHNLHRHSGNVLPPPVDGSFNYNSASIEQPVLKYGVKDTHREMKNNKIAQKLDRICKRLEFIDVYSAESRTAGGWRMRLALARALFKEPVEKCLRDANVDKTSVHYVVLVGGFTRSVFVFDPGGAVFN